MLGFETRKEIKPLVVCWDVKQSRWGVQPIHQNVCKKKCCDELQRYLSEIKQEYDVGMEEGFIDHRSLVNE